MIGVDITPGGRLGGVGNVAGQVSSADVGGDGGHLPFVSRTFDSIIARHNLEHYVDTLATLREWRRVLRPGGTVAVIVPDEASYPGRTLDLDPTHYHGFTQDSLAALMEASGFTPIQTAVVIPQWSFMLVAQKA